MTNLPQVGCRQHLAAGATRQETFSSLGTKFSAKDAAPDSYAQQALRPELADGTPFVVRVRATVISKATVESHEGILKK